MAKKKDAWSSDGRGGIVAAAIFGLITISAGMGAYYTSSLAPNNPYPTYAFAVPDESRAQAIARGVMQQPCVAMVGHDDIDLCAQWRAAVAAEHAAFWGFAQMALSLAGLIGLLITLVFNQKALVLAAESQSETRRIGRAQVRSYLDLSKVRLHISAEGIPSVSLALRNVGQSPAIKVEANTTVEIFNSKRKDKEVLECFSPAKVPSIMSGDRVKFIRRPCSSGIAKNSAEIADSKNNDVTFVAIIEVVWRDVFGSGQRIRLAYTLPKKFVRDQDMKMVPTAEFLARLTGEVVRRKHIGVWKPDEMEKAD